MSKAVMISIRPKWCQLIASGEKTVEVRKTRPNLQTPFKCYVYCTMPSKAHQTICGCMVLNSDELYRHPKQGIKYGYSIELMCCDDEYSADNFLNGKVLGEFTCDNITNIFYVSRFWIPEHIEKGSCMSLAQIREYANGAPKVYGWHISDLAIYDKPKELSEFAGLRQTKFGREPVSLKRPPQSWCYIEEMEE